MEEKAKVKLTIDGKEVYAREGMTILEAAKENAIHIPTLCHHPALSSWGGCRICVVEVDGAPRLVASCVMPVREGMQVVTSNERILDSRRTILEFLFAERNHYCMFCAQSGDCELQSLAYELQMDHLTVPFSFNKFPVDNTNEYMSLDHNRCILCGRCVRACRELAGNFVLNYQNRGGKSLIGKDLNEMSEDSTCDSSGVCLQVCPTGAIYSRLRPHSAVKGKGKELKKVETVCPRCGLLCPIVVSVRDNNLVRIDGALDGERPDRGQLCVKGRFEPLKTMGKRLETPLIKGKGGEWTATTWVNALNTVVGALKKAGSLGKDGVFGVASGQCSNEELLLLREVLANALPGGHVDVMGGEHLRTISHAWKELGRTFLGLKETSWKRIAEADFILFAGADPHDSQPLLASLVRRGMIERGARVGVIGSNDVMAPWSSFFLSVPEKRLPVAVNALLGEVVSSIQKVDPVTRWTRIQDEVGTANSADLIKRLKLTPEGRESFHGIARAFADAKAPIVIAGGEVTGPGDAGALRCLMYLALLKGLLPNETLRLVTLKPNGNSAGAIKLGIAPDGDRPVGGRWRAGILLMGDEEAPDADLIGRLKGTEFLAVIAPYYMDELAEKATVLIPKPLWTEEDGTYTSLDGTEVAQCTRAIRPPAGVKASWETLRALADGFGLRPDFAGWERVRDRVMVEMNISTPAK